MREASIGAPSTAGARVRARGALPVAMVAMMMVLACASMAASSAAVEEYDPPPTVPHRFCEVHMPGVSARCCAAVSGVFESPPPLAAGGVPGARRRLPEVRRDTGEEGLDRTMVTEGLTPELRGGSLSTHFLSELAYASGRRLPFDVGHFNHCRNIAGSRYFLATVSTPDRGMAERLLEVGICAPAACAPADVDALLRGFGAVREPHPAVARLLCANPLMEHRPEVDCYAAANTTSLADLSLLGFKSIANAVRSHLDGDASVRLEVTSSATDRRRMGASSYVLQYLYLAFLALLAAGAWAEKVMGFSGLAASRGSEPPASPSTSLGSALLTVASCFSVPSNFRKLRGVPPPTETDCLNGMRVLTMVWIIVGHTMLMPAAIAGYDNEGDLVATWGYRGTFVLQSILGAEVGVDTFFFLSGFLAFRLLPVLSPLARRTGSVLRTTLLACSKRYTRLTPSLVFVMLIYWKILPYYGAGPFVVRFQSSVFRRCDPYWWTQLLYIQNFVPFDSDEVCMGWSWYLGNDMCFFLVTPAILIAYERSRRLGWAILLALFSLSTAVTCALIYHFELGLYIYDRHFQDYAYWAYSKPYTRIAAYLVGLGAAFFYAENKAALSRAPASAHRLASAAAAATMAVIVFAVAFNFDVPNSWGMGVCLLYLGFARQAWALCCAVVTVSCAVGAMPWVNAFLSLDLWVPFARLCYGAYLVHPVVIKFVAANVTNYYHFSPADTVYRSIVNSLASFGCATVVYLAFERPIMTLESRLSGRERKRE